MKVEKEYKQTELGPIPVDWNYKTFGEVMKGFSSGQTPSRSVKKYFSGKTPWITSGELNYNVITDTIEKITDEAVVKTHLKTIPIGTFLIAITGLEAEGTRGSCAITGIEATTNQSCMALYPNKDELTSEYLFQFYVKYGDMLALKYCQGTKQQSYTGRIAKTLPIIFPPTIEEQNAITKALSETDCLIDNLQKLINKKQNIKQATMQVLLTGKKRLKSFKSEWDTRRLGEVLKFQVGYPFESNYFNKEFDGIRLIKNRDLKSDDTQIYYNGNYSKEFLVKNGDVLIGMDGDFMTCFWDRGIALLNQRVGKIIPSPSICLPFIYYYLMKKLKEIEYSTSSTTVKHLSHKDVENIVLPLPSKTEQEAIGTILSDMDEEIKELKKQYSKYIMMKEGLMQDLLTGKVRLTK